MSQPSAALAQRLVGSALGVASESSAAVSVVVVDLAGRIVAGARSDGASWVSWEVAARKAAAAASLGAPTHQVRAMAADDPMLTQAVDGVPEVLVIPGGFPLHVENALVGGVGVAGAHYQQDQQIGEAVLTAAALA